ncbi:adenylate/guanylate cyclase domain-containing protein [Kamptonema formosum]|uniref:adenylate/guanylate cyclase domain-containing protein n=1 Tax=Kamptonema formosum TaxID=331992 RepID=UPI00034B6E17|nr:adenylate/guanylate cyclase domain-containing protein [Oscillatoria sp. PCC 10802]
MNLEIQPFNADILVVDDMPANLRLLVNILRENGYKVRAVTDGNSSLEIAFAAPPDLILLDILMPYIDGYEVCQKLKANPQTRDIPVIFLSALSEGLDKSRAFQVGAADYITKPFQIEEVLARVANQLSQRSLQKVLQEQTELLQQKNEQFEAEIAERKLLEEKLLVAEQKMRAVFEAMSDLVIAINIQGFQLGELEILPTNMAISYHPDRDLVSPTLDQFFQVETSQEWLSSIHQALESRQTVHFDYCLDIGDKKVWLAAALSPFRDDSVILVARDISDRKEAEEALRIAEERYHSIVENAIDGIFQSTPDGGYLSVNPALAKMYGYASPEELMESVQNIAKQLYVDPNRRLEFLAAIETNDAVSGFESKIYRKDGSTIWISETARGVRDSTGKLLYCEGIVSNITERVLMQEALNYQQKQTEELLLNILPQPIAERLQEGESPIADHFDEVTVLFADLVGFTEFSASKAPAELVKFLNQIFSAFDQLAEKHSLEKIKTIGDAYMVAGGLPVPRQDSAAAVALMALDMQAALASFNGKNSAKFQLRIGIHIGPVVAGVIGMSKFIYDLWGDTVNTASRMESSGLPGKIQVSAATCERLKDKFEFEKRGRIAVKGKGEMLTYWLLGKR